MEGALRLKVVVTSVRSTVRVINVARFNLMMTGQQSVWSSLRVLTAQSVPATVC